MSYVDNNIMPGEAVLHRGQVHWFVFVLPAIYLALAAVTVVKIRSAGVIDSPLPGLIVVALIAAGLWGLLKAVVLRISIELAVTNKRVIAKTGLIRRKTIELNHGKVESFSVDQSVLGRMFGFGTIVVNGTGGGRTPIPNIDDPLEFRRKAVSAVDDNSIPATA